ncbi:glycosyltransferase [Cellulomonas hominis]
MSAHPDRPVAPWSASVVVPAHDEEQSIGRLLTALTTPPDGDRLEVVVVCNGCTDRTAERARAFAGVRVVEVPEPSKSNALRVGDAHASTFPRAYVDADVEIDAAAVLRLVAAVGPGRALASGPARSVPRDRAGWLVRWYYDVWERLPQVRDGLFGRGVIVVSAAGHTRIRDLPTAMSDDLAFSEAFAPAERVVVGSATVVVHPPRTARDLVRRRTRVATGNTQASDLGLRHQQSQTSWGTLGRMVRAEPLLAPRVAVFLGVGLLARVSSRRAVRAGDFTTWQRDASSRDG